MREMRDWWQGIRLAWWSWPLCDYLSFCEPEP